MNNFTFCLATRFWRRRVTTLSPENGKLRATKFCCAPTSRALNALAPDGRELIISCGAALQHLISAIHALGHASIVQVLDDAKAPDLLARVRLCGSRTATPDDELLFLFIQVRHSHRGHFAARELSPV